MSSARVTDADVRTAAARRRTFAIISHTDAGKTTLTEKFLLFAGAVRQAGAVRSRTQAKTTTSDWMALEQQQGISISSTALHFPDIELGELGRTPARTAVAWSR